MRRFSQKEKGIIKLINNNRGQLFSDLFSNQLTDMKLKIDRNKNRVDIRYKTKGFHPSPSELPIITEKSNKLFEFIYHLTNLISFFQKEGYLTLYANDDPSDRIELGDTTLHDAGVFNELKDKFVADLLLDYFDKRILTTEEFGDFIKNGFITRTEKYQIKSIRVAYISLSFAILLGLYGIFENYISNVKGQRERKFEMMVLKKHLERLDSTLQNMTVIKNNTDSIKKKLSKHDL